jgi:hypothetical protein
VRAWSWGSVDLNVLGAPRTGGAGRLALVTVIFDRAEVKRPLEPLCAYRGIVNAGMGAS